MKNNIKKFIMNNTEMSEEDTEETLNKYIDRQIQEEEEAEEESVDEYISSLFENNVYVDDIYFWAPETGEEDD